MFFILLAGSIITGCQKDDNFQVIPAPPGAPGITTVLTDAPEFVSTTSALLGGNIKLDVDGPVFESGIILYAPGTTALDDQGLPSFVEPVIGGTTQKIVSVSASVGDFSVEVTNLAPNTVYRYKAYAANRSGTFYGDPMYLVTSYGTVVDYEGNIYQTIKIDERVWMRENLKSTIYSADTSCINGCYQKNDDSYNGKRYTWDAANYLAEKGNSKFIQGVCPVGWHVPSDGEFKDLLAGVGIKPDDFSSDPLVTVELLGFNQAGMFKDAGTDKWSGIDITNSTGFSVLPADVCPSPGVTPCVKTAFWTTTPNIFYGFQSESEKIVRGINPSSACGFSVRCIKDYYIPEK